MTQLRDGSIDTIEEGGRRRTRTRSEWRDGSIDTVGRRITRKERGKDPYDTIERRTPISESAEAAATHAIHVPTKTATATLPYRTLPDPRRRRL